MNHMEFIEKNVRSELLKQGFSASLAQGGQCKQWTYTNACRKPQSAERCLMTAYDTQNYGQRKMGYQMKSHRRDSGRLQVLAHHCSENGKPLTALTVSGAYMQINWINSQE